MRHPCSLQDCVLAIALARDPESTFGLYSTLRERRATSLGSSFTPTVKEAMALLMWSEEMPDALAVPATRVCMELGAHAPASCMFLLGA